MKNLTAQTLILLLFYLCTCFSAKAEENYYISPNGGGNGSSSNSPASYSELRTKLSSILSSNDRTLNVYWADGEYNITNGNHITFPTSNSTISGLNITFQPTIPGSKEVRILGASGSSRFVVVSGGSSSQNMKLTIKDFLIQNFESTASSGGTSGDYSLFTVGAYSTLNVEGIRVRNVNSRYNPLVTITGSNGKFYATNCLFKEIKNTSSNCFFQTASASQNSCTVSFDNCTFDEVASGTSSNFFYLYYATNINFILKNNCFTNCTSTSDFFYINSSANTIVNVEGNLFYDNTAGRYFWNMYGINPNTFSANSFIRNTSSNYFFYLNTYGTYSIYNNTFSNNTTSRAIHIGANNTNVLNNTVYNSGDIYIGNYSSVNVRNNLVFGSSYINPSNATTGATAAYNISNEQYFEGSIPQGGVSGGVSISELYDYLNLNLTAFDPENYDYTNPPMHELLEINATSHPILRMGSKAGYTDILTYDQRGVKRPTGSKISVGAWDMATIIASESDNKYIYDADEGIQSPGYIIIDLSKSISIPEHVSYDDLTITLSRNLTNGTLTRVNDYTYEFRPTPDPFNSNYVDEDVVGRKSTIRYTVEYTDNSTSVSYPFISSNELSVTIVDVNSPLGLIDKSLYDCFAEFYPGDEFVADFKYITNSTIFYGFTVPLVGDLDGDGYPEIVTMGSSGGNLSGNYTHICILNGQTGKEIVKIPFTDLGIGNFSYAPSSAYHGSPSVMALVDSDRDGKAEIIIAITTGGNYPRRLVSYEINDKTFEPVSSELPLGSTERLTRKWISDRTYTFRSQNNSTDNTADAYAFPIPQIVDIDGDGNPEIVVYNKIFDARTGELKVVFDDLYFSSTSAGGKNDAISAYKNFAYIGRNRYARVTYDTFLNCSSVYDLDGDGKYEIIAGGKVYYGFDLTTGAWKVKSADDMGLEIGDGYTAVADVDGDGKAEIVVVKMIQAPDGYNGVIRMQVWDPGFLKRTADDSGWEKENNPDTSSPILMAQIDIPSRKRIGDYGSMSFVYIGDIDGKISTNRYNEQVKLPEISILQGQFYSSASGLGSLRKAAPIHPNVNRNDFPLDGNGYINYSSGVDGAIGSWTWDETGTTPEEKLKLSFILEHNDRSVNTGFTFFDFDNDGCQDICYRDETTLRIISPRKPFITVGETDTEIIRFKYNVRSFTGFEYPVIADIDNDGSADMIVMGTTVVDNANSYIYAVQADPNVSKFAPAPTVWNQFHYHPLKINEDLTTPLKNIHPLDPKVSYYKNVQNEAEEDFMVKEFIYNNTTTQVPKFILKDIPSEDVPLEEWEIQWTAIMPTPDASFSDGMIDIPNSRASFYVKNLGDAALNGKQLIAVYRDEVGAPDNSGSKTKGFLGTFPISDTEDIRPGDSIFITYNLATADLYDKYIFRVLDASSFDGTTFYPGFVGGNEEESRYCPSSYFDCDVTNNTMVLSIFAAVDDICTVLQYETITIPVFDNDLFPDAICPNPTLNPDEIITPEGTGILSGDFGSIKISADGKSIIYTAPATYSDVVKISYRLNCEDRMDLGYVYIYVVESCTNSFAVCYGETYNVCLREKPDGTTFEWFSDAAGTMPITAPTDITMTGSQTSYTYYIKPKVPDYASLAFPIVPLTIHAISDGVNETRMRWTGVVDTDWSNPYNWLQLVSGNYVVPDFAPSTCVDVELPGGLDRYPMLTDSVGARYVTVKDRGMISGTHLLEYTEATVEVNFDKDTERDRWVMYSAPLRKTYSGDYMLVDYNTTPNTPKPIYRAVYMSFFQSANPDQPGSVPTEYSFTKPFGNVGQPLGLGKAFNVWIDTDIDQTTPFIFPSPFDQYSYDVHGPWNTDAPGSNTGDSISHVLDRMENGVKVSGRFILEDKPYTDLDLEGGFRLASPDDDANFELVMIPNPFMAYLDMEKFLAGNQEAIELGYKIWGGKDDNFISYHLNEASWYDRVWFVDQPGAIIGNELPKFIAPLQSFMVMKKANNLIQLKFSPSMTVTERPAGITGDYELKNSMTDPQGLLRIQASSGDISNSTILINAPGAPNSFGYEDSRKVFYDYELSGYAANEIGNSLNVYTITPQNIPLAINMMGDFSYNVPIGIRLNFTGQVRFDFTNVEKFGYKLFLNDGNTIVNLTENPVYIAEVQRPASSSETFYEINDRFFLKVEANETGIEETESAGPIIRLTTQHGVLHINSTVDIRKVELYSIMGNLVYTDNSPSTQYTIDKLNRGQVYIVKMYTYTGREIRKVIIK